MGGGSCYTLDALDEIAAAAKALDCATHMDGARIFNAAEATGVSVARMCEGYDSVSICFSKGLGAPVGSVLVGSHAFIQRAHRWRKMFGGGWRQAGLLADACLHALDHHVGRLRDDHRRARTIAEALNDLSAFSVDLRTVQTNMVYVDCIDLASDVVSVLAAHGVDVLDTGAHRIRFVVHLHITDDDVDQLLAVCRQEWS